MQKLILINNKNTFKLDSNLFMVLSTCQDVDHLSLLTVQRGGVEALTDLYHRGRVGHPGLDHVPQLPPPDMKRFKTLRLLFISFFNNPYGI